MRCKPVVIPIRRRAAANLVIPTRTSTDASPGHGAACRVASRRAFGARPARAISGGGASPACAPISPARACRTCASDNGPRERGLRAIAELAGRQLAEPCSLHRDGGTADAEISSWISRGGERRVPTGTASESSISQRPGTWRASEPVILWHLMTPCADWRSATYERHRIVELRFFGGLNLEEIAEVLGVAPITVSREWAKARAWLHREVTRQPPGAPRRR